MSSASSVTAQGSPMRVPRVGRLRRMGCAASGSVNRVERRNCALSARTLSLARRSSAWVSMVRTWPAPSRVFRMPRITGPEIAAMRAFTAQLRDAHRPFSTVDQSRRRTAAGAAVVSDGGGRRSAPTPPVCGSRAKRFVAATSVWVIRCAADHARRCMPAPCVGGIAPSRREIDRV
jgi:hypothetical protein